MTKLIKFEIEESVFDDNCFCSTKDQCQDEKHDKGQCFRMRWSEISCSYVCGLFAEKITKNSDGRFEKVNDCKRQFNEQN